MTDPVSGLVLAAGAGRRFGGPKAELLLHGVRLIDRAVRTLLDGGCDDVVAVVRSAEVRAADARCVVNPDADSGMASSLRCGLQAVTSAAAVIVLVDQVGITSAQVATLIDCHRAGAPVVAACRDGMRSHPVLVSRPWFGDFGAAAVGDSGARAFLDSRTDIVRFVDFDAPITDIDTPADLAALQ